MTERKARMFEISNDYINSALAIGMMVLAGQLYLKKPVSSAVNSLVKSVMGFIVFNVGVALFLSATNDLRNLVNIACGIHAESNTNVYFQTKGIYYVPVMALGFILHLLLEKYLVKPEKRIANMGGCHVILRVSLLTTGIGVVTFGSSNWLLIVVVSTVVCALWYTVQPKIVDRLITVIRGDDKGAYGHQTSISLLITSVLCRLLFKEKKDDTEDIKIPKQLALLRDMGFCMFFLQSAVTVVFGLMCGTENVSTLSGNTNPYLWLLFEGLKFASGYIILTTGLRAITQELVPVCDALRRKIIPDAKTAMDVPTVFPFGQNAVLFGAVSGSIKFITLLFIFAKAKLGFIGGATLYFYMVAGGSAVYGNKVAGRKGAILAGIVTAFCMAFGSLLIQKLGGQFYMAEYFCNVCSEPDDRLLLYPIVYLIYKVIL